MNQKYSTIYIICIGGCVTIPSIQFLANKFLILVDVPILPYWFDVEILD
jgi:hypothetical protein